MKTSKISNKTEFLNIDLDLVCPEKLSPLLKEVSKQVFELYHEKKKGKDTASLEINDIYPGSQDAEKTLRKFCDILEKLTPTSKRIWNKCKRKCFNIGFEAGSKPYRFEEKLSVNTLKRVAKLNANIEITIYSIGKK